MRALSLLFLVLAVTPLGAFPFERSWSDPAWCPEDAFHAGDDFSRAEAALGRVSVMSIELRAQEMVDALTSNPLRLTHLNIRLIGLSEHDIDLLVQLLGDSALQSVTVLVLEAATMDELSSSAAERVLSSLATMPSLSALKISSRFAESLPFVEGLPRLALTALDVNIVDPAGSDARLNAYSRISSLKRLHTLDVGDVKALRKLALLQDSLVDLHIGLGHFNHIDEHHDSLVEYTTELAKFRNLRRLSIRSSGEDPSLSETIARPLLALTELRVLRLTWVAWHADDGAVSSIIAKLPALQMYVVSREGGTTASDFAALARSNSLTHIRLPDGAKEPEGIKELMRLETLEVLVYGQPGVELATFRGHPSLRRFSRGALPVHYPPEVVCDIPNLEAYSLEAYWHDSQWHDAPVVDDPDQLPSPVELRLDTTATARALFLHILSRGTLRKLELRMDDARDDLGTREMAEALGRNHGLRELRLADWKGPTNELLALLPAFPELHGLEIAEFPTDEALSVLAKLPSLRTLSLRFIGITNAQKETLEAALPGVNIYASVDE